jgi:hypothetical protein
VARVRFRAHWCSQPGFGDDPGVGLHHDVALEPVLPPAGGSVRFWRYFLVLAIFMGVVRRLFGADAARWHSAAWAIIFAFVVASSALLGERLRQIR